ncbi:MAG: cell division protein SepF [Bacilli bacterium]|nr:cell division protein SepF [Bacilli bacterium]
MKDKLKGFFGTGEEPEERVVEEEGFYKTSREEYHEQNGIAGSKMMLLEPRAYSESQQIADYLKRRNAVVVNLKRVTPDQAKRIVDFLYGTIYAIDGDIQKLGGGIFLCTPNNVVVDGKISDETGPQGQKPERTGADYLNDREESSEDDFF